MVSSGILFAFPDHNRQYPAKYFFGLVPSREKPETCPPEFFLFILLSLQWLPALHTVHINTQVCQSVLNFPQASILDCSKPGL